MAIYSNAIKFTKNNGQIQIITELIQKKGREQESNIHRQNESEDDSDNDHDEKGDATKI